MTTKPKTPLKSQQRLYLSSRKVDQLRERVLDWANSRSKPFCVSDCVEWSGLPYKLIEGVLDDHAFYGRITVVREPKKVAVIAPTDPQTA